jgi:hypothetical protein
MSYHYWGIRPKTMPDHVRIERAHTPQVAARLAFGRGSIDGFQYKDFGRRVAVIQSDNKRISLIKDHTGWIDFPHEDHLVSYQDPRRT